MTAPNRLLGPASRTGEAFLSHSNALFFRKASLTEGHSMRLTASAGLLESDQCAHFFQGPHAILWLHNLGFLVKGLEKRIPTPFQRKFWRRPQPKRNCLYTALCDHKHTEAGLLRMLQSPSWRHTEPNSMTTLVSIVMRVAWEDRLHHAKHTRAGGGSSGGWGRLTPPKGGPSQVSGDTVLVIVFI